MNISGKRVLISGGLGGVGAALVPALTDAGAEVFIFDREPDSSSHSFRVDITDEAAVERALESLDRVDVLINCAGQIHSEPLVNFMKKERHSRASWDQVISSNLTGCFTLCVQVAHKMAAQRTRGVIINFSSVSARGNAGQAAYAAAKAGVEALTTVIAKEMGMLGIRAVAIAPGFIDTPSTRNSLSEGMLDHWIRQTPLRRLGKADDIVKTVLYILECDHLTGCTIPVDGALSL